MRKFKDFFLESVGDCVIKLGSLVKNKFIDDKKDVDNILRSFPKNCKKVTLDFSGVDGINPEITDYFKKKIKFNEVKNVNPLIKKELGV